MVVIHPPLTLTNESVLLAISPDAGCTHEGLMEVRVDRGTCDGFKTLQLTRGGYVEPLSHNTNFKCT